MLVLHGVADDDDVHACWGAYMHVRVTAQQQLQQIAQLAVQNYNLLIAPTTHQCNYIRVHIKEQIHQTPSIEPRPLPACLPASHPASHHPKADDGEVAERLALHVKVNCH